MNDNWKRELEKTVVIIKPDGVKRGLTGRIIRRFERMGLKMVACKMVMPAEDVVKVNYPDPEENKEWVIGMGNKTLSSYQEYQRDVVEDLGTADPYEVGMIIYENLINYWTSGPVVAMVWQGHQAVKQVRELIGNTKPSDASPGTIRGDFSFESPLLSTAQGRVVLRNLVHASGDVEEAREEIKNWFGDEKHFDDYERADHGPMMF